MKKLLFTLIMTLFSASLLLGCSKKPHSVDFADKEFNKYVYYPSDFDKYDMISKHSFEDKTLYTLGTWHWNHFYEQANYSFHDIQCVIENINPDVVYIESREDTFEAYGALDGPIDMIFIYSYCLDHQIPVQFIDYWYVDDNFLENQNSTSDERDNKIFNNIYEKLNEEDKDATVLVCYGSAHFYNQLPRYEYAGFEQIPLDNDTVKSIFKRRSGIFNYPESMEKVLDDSIEYSQNGFKDIIEANVTDEDLKEQILNSADEGANAYILYRSMVINGEEYFTY